MAVMAANSGMLSGMKRIRGAVVVALTLVLTACGAEPNEPASGEHRLTDTYEAVGQPYPLTVPVFLACDHFRVVGETEERPLGDLFLYTPDKDFTQMSGPLSWAERFCEE